MRDPELMPVLRASRQHKRELVDRLAKTQPASAAEQAAMRGVIRRGRGSEVN